MEHGSSFFLSPQGHRDFEAELTENLHRFQNDQALADESLFCRFPFRKYILQKYFGLNTNKVNCPKLEEWRSRLRSEKVSLVFPTQFSSNPASVMGHTFFKFSTQSRPSHLHQSLSYSASVNEPIKFFTYVYKGLFGGYQGHFLEAPFYEKLLEYDDIEQRDIWIYELKMKPQEIDLLVDFLWELKTNARFSYFFLRENCSFIPLAAIETILPTKNLTDGFGFYLAPYMSLKRLNDSHLVNTSTYRQSSKKKYIESIDQLTRRESLAFYKTIKDQKYRNVSAAYDTALINFIAFKERHNPPLSVAWNNLLGEVLLKTSQAPIYTRPPRKPPKNPVNAHGPRHLEVRLGNLGAQRVYSLLRFRPGIHGNMDSSAGFIPHSAFSFLETDLRFVGPKSLELSRFQLFNFRNLEIYHLSDPGLSWKGNAEMRKADVLCIDCTVQEINFQVGAASDLYNGIVSQLTVGLEQSFVSKGIRRHPTFGVVEIEFMRENQNGRTSISQNFSHVLLEESFMRVETLFEMRFFQILRRLDLSYSLRYQKVSYHKEFVDQNLGLIYDF